MADAENTNFEFGIENFKPYEDLQSIELGKITLIYGSNSSGKSSFVQSFLCAAQSLGSHNCSLSLNGDLVECGTYETVLNKKVSAERKDIACFFKEKTSCSGNFFSISHDSSDRELMIDFSLDLQPELKMFFNKSSTPGILLLSKINLLFACLNSTRKEEFFPDAWLSATKPLPPNDSFVFLEDIDNKLVEACLQIIELISADLSRCLLATTKEQNNSKNENKIQKYVVQGDVRYLNLLRCACLQNGIWLQSSGLFFNGNGFIAELYVDSFIAKQFPTKNSALISKIFGENNISDIFDELQRYYCIYSGYSKEFKGVRYVLGIATDSSWSIMHASKDAVVNFVANLFNDEMVVDHKNKIIKMISKAQEKLSKFIEAGRDLPGALAYIDKDLKMYASNLEHDSKQEISQLVEIGQPDILLRENLSNLFNASAASVHYLHESVDLVLSFNKEWCDAAPSNNDNLDLDDVREILCTCDAVLEEIKKIFADIDKVNIFLELVCKLSAQLLDGNEILMRAANKLSYFNDSVEWESIEKIQTLLSDIEEYFHFMNEKLGGNPSNKSIPRLNQYIPFFKTLEFLPQFLGVDSVLHLGPDRASPKRSYKIDDIQIDALLRHLPVWDAERVEHFPEAYSYKYKKDLSDLQILGNDIVRFNTSDPLIASCSVGILRDNHIVNICDLGFGVSQVMPLVIASKIPDKDLIVVQQPETHLHPEMQADLGDLLINSINTKRWLIETHSEVLMLRILRRIREGDFSASDLKIYFVDQRDGKSRIINMKFSDSGDLLTRWPKGFFAQESEEIF